MENRFGIYDLTPRYSSPSILLYLHCVFLQHATPYNKVHSQCLLIFEGRLFWISTALCAFLNANWGYRGRVCVYWESVEKGWVGRFEYVILLLKVHLMDRRMRVWLRERGSLIVDDMHCPQRQRLNCWTKCGIDLCSNSNYKTVPESLVMESAVEFTEWWWNKICKILLTIQY